MSLTQAQADDVRRYCGYPVVEAIPYADVTIAGISPTIDLIIAAMTPTQVATVTTMLAALNLTETTIYGSIGDLDTNRAAVWYRNPNEITDMQALFTFQRRQLCFALGIPVGPGLGVYVPAVFVV